MPEGHSVHRIARQFRLDFVGSKPAASSPQGRFAAGAELIDGLEVTAAEAVGKQMFVTFGADKVLRVHLGIYGAWDFSGRVSPLFAGAEARGSLGAPRRGVRVGETERDLGPTEDPDLEFPPPPIGQVRLRLLNEHTVADLRGPTACEVLNPAEAQGVIDRLGPDPQQAPDRAAARAEFTRRLTKRRTPVGQLLMDQNVVAGIGNIYRAEMLFRARLNPYQPGNTLGAEVAADLWADWEVLLEDGIRSGAMLTRHNPDDAAGRALALADVKERYWVYGRAGQPCRVCATPIALAEMQARKLYFCPSCQGV